MLDLNEIVVACEAATPGPWEFVDGDDCLYIQAPGVPWGTPPTIPYRIVSTEFYMEPPSQERERVAANLRFAAQARAWVPALVAELAQAREELAAVDESLGDFYAPVLDPETDEPCGSFWKDHSVWVMRDELERARAEIERLKKAQADDRT